MKMAWKEMLKYKARYLILGSIIFLISLLTLIISGLATGLSTDNASLIKNLPEGTFYMEESAEERINFSSFSEDSVEALTSSTEESSLFSIQMGELVDTSDQPYAVAFVTSSNDEYFPTANRGEVILDSSFQEEGFEVGDTLTSDIWGGEFTIKAFRDQEKYSHSPVGFIHPKDYEEMYHDEGYQAAFTAEEGPDIEGMEALDNGGFLDVIPSYSAEQLSLNMITIFLFIISGLLFAIFFYMINVQKLSTFGILKAVGVKTISLFIMMWVQMLVITSISLILAVILSQMFDIFAPNGMPFDLPVDTLLGTVILFIVIGFIGVTISGVQIRKVEPMQAINQGGV
jgi:putative ABC transport system permease protein